MADTHDGSITIDTEMDNSGFEKDSEKMQSSIEALGRSIENVAAAADRAFESTRQIANRLATEIGSLAGASEQGFNSDRQVAAFSRRVGQATERLESARELLAEFAQQQIPTEEYREVTAEIDRAEKSLSSLLERQAMMQDLGVDTNSAQWRRVAAQIELTRDQLGQLRYEEEHMRETGAAFIRGEDTEQFEALRESLEQSERALEVNRRLINQEAIEQARLNVLTAQEAVANANSTRERTQALAQLRAAQEELTAVYRQSVTPRPQAAAQSAWERFGDTMKTVASGIWNVTKWAGKNIFGRMISGIKNVTSQLLSLNKHTKRTKSGFDGLLKGLNSFKRMLVSRIKRTFMSYLFNQITEAVKELAKFDGGFNQSISNLRNRTKELGANLVVTFSHFLKEFEPILTRLIQYATIAVVKLNALLSALRGEDMMAAAKEQTEDYAQSLENAGESADKATKAQQKLNKTLMSYDQIHKLDDNNDTSGADSVDISDLYAAIETESILAYVSDFAKNLIQRLKEAIRNGNWYTVGAIIAEGLNGAVAVIDEKIREMQGRLTEWARLLASGLNGLMRGFDSYALGQALADGINTAFMVLGAFISTFDFTALGILISNGIDGLFLNIDWLMIGGTLADGANGIMDTLYTIFTGTSWYGIAASITAGLNEFIGTVDWAGVGLTFAASINAFLATALGAVQTFDWSGAGDALRTAFENFVTGIEWNDLADILSGGLNGLLDTAIALFDPQKMDWKKAASKITAAIQRMIKKVDFAKVGKLLSDALKTAFDIMTGAVQGIDWRQAGADLYNKIVDFFANIDWNGIREKEWELAKEALVSLGELLAGVLIGTDDEPGGVFGGLEHLGERIFDAMHGIGGETIDGIFGGINDAITMLNPVQWLYVNVVQRIIDAIKENLGIHSPSTVMAEEVGEPIVAGLFEGIRDAWKNFKSKVAGKFDELKTKLKNISFKNVGAGLVDKIKTGVSDKWDALKYGAVSLYEGLRDTLKDIKTEVAGNSFVAGLKDGITGKWEELKTKATELFNSLLTAFENSNFAATAEKIVTGLKDGFTSFWNSDLMTKAGELLTALGEKIKGFSLYNVASDVVDSFKDGLNFFWQNVLTALGNRLDELIDKITGFFNSESNPFNNLFGGNSAGLFGDKLTRAAAEVSDLRQQIGGVTAELYALSSAVPAFNRAGIPAIAAGTLAPSKVRVPDGGGYRENSEISALLRQILEAIGNGGTGGTTNINLSGTDEAEIIRIIKKYTARNTRITNGGKQRWNQ